MSVEASGNGKATDGDGTARYAPADPEEFARNMARVVELAGKAASAWIAPRERGEAVDAGPITAADFFGTLSKVADFWLTDPRRLAEAQSNLIAGYFGAWSEALKPSDDAGSPAKQAISDKRFAHPEWTRNPFYDALRRFYLSAAAWADDLVVQAQNIDPHTRGKAAFYMRQLMHAASPSNFLLTNPELLQETMASNGANLVRGMAMFAEDMAAGNGTLRLRQVATAAFEVGRDMALTPGKVIAQTDVCQVIQYAASTETVLQRPLLIVPPWINKFYVLDLNPAKSFIRWAVEQGHTVFVLSWVNPDESHAAKDWRDYIHDGIVFGLDTIRQATGEAEVNAVSYCVGGTLLGAALAYLKSIGDERIRSATFLTTQIDFTHAGDLKVFVDEEQLASLADVMQAKGYLDGSRMAAAFNMLRAGDLIWPYFVNNYLRGKDPLPFDLLHWNADATRMPRANHLFYLRNCYLENRLSTGRMEIGGHTVDLSKVEIPVYNLATREDHIAPALSVYTGSRFLGSDVTFVVSGSGHIAGVVNPPDKQKYQFWTGPRPSAETPYEEWLLQASETKGSWWPHWQSWIAPLAGPQVPARTPGGETLHPIEDAPGSYVRVRS
ncbi:PHA/PHB synthase family protein [Aureimonas leprariae]|uniref:Class I poly(R)-hydroxyalkanoic acid synthase n=1 Tax=Plantimonas leprariae TaxID=2615207 RepID=A0A7V7PR37_9HYPH|nr:class I poly(R)-hydroxyalkanoic acid synthase [Aureimonas leprariae]KAB0680903.1 class I poly(R)-hydroxyalkanoic acid synthase [Aureimonas leprariae]